MGTIYKIENNINDKIYIGQTIQDLKIRFRRHCSFSALSNAEWNMPIKRAIKKYGKENFFITEIESVKDEDINEREIYWIEKYGSFKNGYNATAGGGGLLNHEGKIKQFQVQEIISKYLDGKTPNELSIEYMVDRKTIMNLLNKNKIKTRSISDTCSKGEISDGLLIKLLSEGKSQRQIAKIINRCQGTVWKLIKKLDQNVSKSVQTLSDCTEG